MISDPLGFQRLLNTLTEHWRLHAPYKLHELSLVHIWQTHTYKSTIQGSHYIVVVKVVVKFKDSSRTWSCIFKDQFSTEVYSMDSITAIFNIYFCDYGTVLVDKNKTW